MTEYSPIDTRQDRPNAAALKSSILRHLTFTLGKDAAHASSYDWRMALSYSLRDVIVGPWFAATRRTHAEDRKRVYYLSMEFLIGRIMEDAATNLGLDQVARAVMADLGQDFDALVEDEPDAALGNGGLGRLAACFMESMATVGCPAYGYGIRYEHGLFRQFFQGGQQGEAPEDWLKKGGFAWEFARPESAYTVPFKGHVESHGGVAKWVPAETVIASAYDTPVVGWQGKWANTLRLWGAMPTTLFDLDRFNRGDYAAAAEPEALARTLSRVLYPDDTTYQGKELRLKQEFFLTSAALQDILRRFKAAHSDLRALPKHVAIQMNDTHPALAGPELVRLLVDENLIPFPEAVEIARACLGYTNHTLLPEALERWATFTFGTTLPRHMQLVEQIDAWHGAKYSRPHYIGIVKHHEVRMGELAFVMAHRVNGVSALHSDLVKSRLFPELHALHPERIINQTNGVTPRRWLNMCNRPLAGLITQTIGTGWQDDLDRLRALEPHAGEAGFQAQFMAAKRANKVALANWAQEHLGQSIAPDALFDVQIKRIHEYKRQLLNILQTIAHYQRIKDHPQGNFVPRIKIFGGKSAPGYAVAKEIIHLINDVAAIVNQDSEVGDRLKILYPPNYNVSMAQLLVPAADLSEQISTAGKEASGTGNMKFMMNGAPTIGTLDGANVEILQQVGDENFFLFGLTAEQAFARRETPDHASRAIEASPALQRVLAALSEGQFSPDQKDRYHGLVHRLWHHDYFLVASDFDAYEAAQGAVDLAYADGARWAKMAILNTARSGYFSSDRTIKSYMNDIWDIQSAL